MSMEEILNSGMPDLGIAVHPEALEKFRKFYEYMVEKNKVMNLTGITEESESARLHFLDCVALLAAENFAGKRVIDVGTGAGFPGIPLKIAEPTLDITLLDSLAKRLNFLDEVIDLLGLENTRTIHARAEEAPAEFREQFDIATARAVTRMDALAELCLPFVKKGGAFVAMKGPAAAEELKEAEKAIKVLGGKVEKLHTYTIPETDVTHTAVVIRKVANTPKQYPRSWGKIKKAPIK